MGFLDFLFGSANQAPDGPDALRAQLFAAVAAGDSHRLRQLCRSHRAAILMHFELWQKPPDALRAAPQEMQRYADGLIGVARCFRSELGRPELMERLVGTPTSNPLLRWEAALGQTRKLVDRDRHHAALALLEHLLPEVRGLDGTGASKYLPITLGFLSECRFHLGQAARAVEPASEALTLCQRENDPEGVIAYLRQLYEIHRYLGRAETASSYAAKLADALRGAPGDALEAAWFEKQTDLVRAGEPLNRVIVHIGDHRHERDAFPRVDGHAVFVFERNRLTLRPCAAATERGDALGTSGDHEGALAAFREAAGADPFGPHPRYLAGFTLLHLGRYIEAIGEYRATEELAPGWYHCRADLFVAECLAAGRIDRNAFTAWVALEDGADTPTEKLALADGALSMFPDFSPFHLQRGKVLAALDRREQAVAAFRSGLGSTPDVGTRTCLLVELAQQTVGEERRALLEQAKALDGDRVMAAMACILLAQGESPA